MDSKRFAEVQSAVEDRLSFVGAILDLQPQLVTPGLIPAGEPGAMPDHPWRHFDSLINYLLLTCFDLLGQGSTFAPFKDWLVGSAYSDERERAKLCVPEGADPIAAAVALEEAYRHLHGNRVSFYRFLDEVLDPALRATLFDSLRLRRMNDAGIYCTDFIEVSEPNKTLYFLRNQYTHQALSIGTYYGGIVPNWYERESAGYSRIFSSREEKGTTTDYFVRRWPGVLVETVKAGLSKVGARSDPDTRILSK